MINSLNSKMKCTHVLMIFCVVTLNIYMYMIYKTNKYAIMNQIGSPLNQAAVQFSVIISGEIYPKHVPLFHNKSINFAFLNANRTRTKTILLWNKMNGLPFRKFQFGHKKQMIANNCPVTNCEITHDRSKFNKSELVLFHLRNKIDYIPKRAFRSQRFVHVIYESPVNCHLCDKFNSSVFNYSATYTPESDYSSIYWTDSGLYWDLNTNFDPAVDFSRNKTQKVAALISNCDFQTSGRNEYLQELKKTIPVRTFGKCGETCPTNCMEYISRDFKFFLAFENSLCNGYITEKFFGWLNYDIVPVVLGLGDYSYYIPKSAYINALDFESPRHLAEYLNYLDRNKTAYNEYFEWKRYIKSDYPSRPRHNGFLCEMCIQLHLEDTLGYVKQKRLVDLDQSFGLQKKCKMGRLHHSNGRFNMSKLGDHDYTYFMSKESWEPS
jgi:alpha-1,3-fucosyltransferase